MSVFCVVAPAYFMNTSTFASEMLYARGFETLPVCDQSERVDGFLYFTWVVLMYLASTLLPMDVF